jgi:hypothetical protein
MSPMLSMVVLLMAVTAQPEIESSRAGLTMSFDARVVRDAPYSAIAEIETTREVGRDRFRTTSRMVIYRDADGRTRRENTFEGTTQSTTIFDPIAGFRYSFKPGGRTAYRVPAAAGPRVEALKKTTPTIELLGNRVIEGLTCEGKRTTTVYPVNAIGNQSPFRVVTEEWYSPELQVLVLTIHDDPRMGKTTYRLTKIARREPDAALFRVPAALAIEDISARLR